MTFWKIFKKADPKKTEKIESDDFTINTDGDAITVVSDMPITSSTVILDPKDVNKNDLLFGSPSYDPVKPIDLMKVKYVDSPNKSARKGDVKYIVLHHTGPGSFGGIVKWLTNPQAKASAHYVLGTGAQLNQLVNTKKKAWHAGISRWNGLDDLNNYSIGIEIQNLGMLHKNSKDGSYYYEQGRNLKKYTGKVEPVYGEVTYESGKILRGYYVPYPEKQLNKLVGLCKALVLKYDLGPDCLITHFDISLPEGRKSDPFGLDVGELATRIFM